MKGSGRILYTKPEEYWSVGVLGLEAKFLPDFFEHS
jgi:hypothetical protein